jgi:hypothetical protein
MISFSLAMLTVLQLSEQQGKNWTADVDLKDESSAIQLSIGINPTYSVGASMMQAITPSITLGGDGSLQTQLINCYIKVLYFRHRNLFRREV